MTGEDIFGMIMIAGISFFCGIVFLGMGIAANVSRKPVGFWTGREVRPNQISDIPAYNRDNGQMWILYSTPYFLAFVFQVLAIWLPGLTWVPIWLLIFACSAGLWWLIRRYQTILRKYSLNQDH